MAHWSGRPTAPNVALVAAADGNGETATIDLVTLPAAVAVTRPVASDARTASADRPGSGGGFWTRARALAADAPGTLVLFVSLVALNLLDLVTTQMVLDRGGEEGNPIMAPVVDDLWLAGLMKAACLAVIWRLLHRSGRSRGMLGVVAAVDLWYVVVVGWNLKVLLHLS
jgi:hypothetical protein